jgi:hypothetical protein
MCKCTYGGLTGKSAERGKEKEGKAIWHSQARRTRRRKSRAFFGSFGLSLCLWSQVHPDPAQQNYRVCVCAMMQPTHFYQARHGLLLPVLL